MTTLTSISPKTITAFQRTVWDYYRNHKRAMPWRREPVPYYVMVSEVMLQQTQVSRVRAKFISFIRQFPTVQDLARAPLAKVLQSWVGLGYNRRAKFLWETAKRIVHDFDGEVPKNQQDLIALPGIGPNTAGAILAYAYNEPAVFIETNIRTVFIHHFFADDTSLVSDESLRQLVAVTLPVENPREWYWALMDYGTHLKTAVGSQLARAKQYRPQTRFEGSRRQVRGQVLRELAAAQKALSQPELAALIPDNRLPDVITTLVAEGLISHKAGGLQLTDT